MDRKQEVRKIAAEYVERYGEAAVEVIRRYCIEAHARGHHSLYRGWRDIGVAADDLVAERLERRFGTQR
jgi:hypothetical protein